MFICISKRKLKWQYPLLDKVDECVWKIEMDELTDLSFYAFELNKFKPEDFWFH